MQSFHIASKQEDTYEDLHNPGHVALLTKTAQLRLPDIRFGARGSVFWFSEANIWPKF